MFLGKNKKIDDTELVWAISEALDIANTEVIVRNIPVTVFCESQRALGAIALPFTCQEHWFLRGFIHQKNAELQNNGGFMLGQPSHFLSARSDLGPSGKP